MPSAASRAPGPEPREYFIAGDGSNPAAFQIVVAPIERLPRDGEFVKEIGHDVFHEFVAPASGVSRHLLKLRLYFRGKVDFHNFGSFSEHNVMRRLGSVAIANRALAVEGEAVR
jgi:hypothetical protein